MFETFRQGGTPPGGDQAAMVPLAQTPRKTALPKTRGWAYIGDAGLPAMAINVL